MTLVHLHLLLNHVPVIGTFFVAFILLAALWRRNEAIAKLGLVALAGVGLVAAAVYFTGEPAEEAVENLAGVADRIIHDHEEAAELAFIGSSIAGVVAVLLLAWSRRRELPRWTVAATLALVLGVAGLMAVTANLGGQIRHTEISGATVALPRERSDDH
jgi:hypothetical protein